MNKLTADELRETYLGFFESKGHARIQGASVIPENDPTYNVYRDISHLPKHIFDEMSHFFSVYKALEHKDTVIDDVKGCEEAKKIIESCIDRYVESFCK